MTISKDIVPKLMGDRIAGRSYKELASTYDLTYSEVRNTCRDYKHQFTNGGEISIADPTRLFSGAIMEPFNPSALISRKGMRILDQMRKDDQVKAAMLFKKMAVLSTGWEIVSPEGEDQEWEQTRFMNAQLKNLESSLEDVLLEVMTGLDYGYCLHGDTKIHTLNGDIPIKDLVGQEPWVFSWVDDNLKLAKASKVWLTKKNSPCVKVTYEWWSGGGGWKTDNIICTDNHPFMMLDGSFIKAGELKLDQRLMPFSQAVKKPGGKERMFVQTSRGYGNTEWDKRARWVLKQLGQTVTSEYDAHHKNMNTLDDRPNNLELVPRAEHRNQHLRDWWASATKEQLQKRRAKQKATNQIPEVKARRSRASTEANLRTWQDPEVKKRRSEGISKGRLGKPMFKSRSYITYQGETLSLQEWVEKTGIPYRQLYHRWRNDWPLDKVFASSEEAMEYRQALSIQKRQIKVLQKESVQNHRVLSVELVGNHDVYDMEVPDTHNFATNTVFVHNSVSEILFTDLQTGDFKGKVGLQAIKTRKPHEFDFKTDKHGNLEHLIQKTNEKDLILPTAKFLIFSYQMEWSNYYGKSDLESAYRAWWIKENAYRWLAMLLERFGIPPIFALYDPNSLTPQQITDLVNVINRIQAATSGALPRANADSLELWTPQLAGQTERVFIPALEMFNKDIARALLMPGLLGATADSAEGSFARAKVHFDVFLLIVSQLRTKIEDTLMDQVVRPMIQLNYGIEDEKLPKFRFLPLTDELRMDVMTQWGQFTDSGLVTPQASDEEHIRKSFKFPDKDEKGDPPIVAQQADEQEQRKLDLEAAAAQPVEEEGAGLPGQDESPEELEALEGELNDQLEEDDELAKLEESLKKATAAGDKKKKTKVKENIHDYDLAARAPNEFEGRIDFAHIERSLDEIEARGQEKLIPAITKVRDRFIKSVGSNFDRDISFLKTVDELKGLAAVRKAFVETMTDAMTTGSEEVRKELEGVTAKEFVDNPNFNAVAAGKFLRSKADFFISGMNDSITKKALIVLSNAIQTGELIADTQKSLKALFEPWVGNPSVVRDGEQLKPHRLETIIRTNATDSFNRGRLLEAKKAGDLVTGFEYSAIIDSATTAVCRHLDEKVFLSGDPTVNEFVPPNHFNCRSILVPIILDEEIDTSDIITQTQRGRARELQQEGFGNKPPVIRTFLDELEAYEFHGEGDQKPHGRRNITQLLTKVGRAAADINFQPLSSMGKKVQSDLDIFLRGIGSTASPNKAWEKIVKEAKTPEKGTRLLGAALRFPTSPAFQTVSDLFRFSEEDTEDHEYHRNHPRNRHAAGKRGPKDPLEIPIKDTRKIIGPLSPERIKELDKAQRKNIILGLGRAGIMRALGFQAKIFKSSKEMKQWGNKEYNVKWLGKLNPKQISTMLWYTGDGARKIGKLITELGKSEKDPAAIKLAIVDIVTDAAKIVAAGTSKKRVKRLSEETEDKSYAAAEDMKFAKEVLKDIDDALAQAEVPDDILVYRGMKTDMFSGDPDDFVGKIITNPGFTSTSLDKKVIIRNKPTDADFVIFEIMVPEGSTGAYLDSGEHEMLLPRDSEFVVTGKRNKHVVEMLLL